MIHSGEEAGPVPELPARPHRQGKKNAAMEDRVLKELHDDFCDPPRTSHTIKLDDSDSDMEHQTWCESALLKEVRITTCSLFCSFMLTLDIACPNLCAIHQDVYNLLVHLKVILLSQSFIYSILYILLSSICIIVQS